MTGATAPRRDLAYEHVLVPGPGPDTLLLLHATGGDEHQLVELGRRLAPRATLLSPRGKELENGVTRRFFRRHSPTELDVPDLLARTDEMTGFVADAAAAYGLDPARVVALGYSNGANVAASLLLRRPGTLRGAALLRPMLPYEPDGPPRLEGTGVLIAAGARDPLIPLAQPERLAVLLEAAGAHVSYRVADAGHELAPSDLADAGAWLAHLMNERPAAP
ncbi:MAG TPA: alpha/beta hydrolase [Miltoncostaeaceae bacterium]|nr:alpha/beta hydrolase [Miltoncostaeaceae bacterium]